MRTAEDCRTESANRRSLRAILPGDELLDATMGVIPLFLLGKAMFYRVQNSNSSRSSMNSVSGDSHMLRCVLLTIYITCLFGCREAPSPPPVHPLDQFKPISDKKKEELESLLVERGSKLITYSAVVDTEKDVDKRVKWTYVARIEFSYAFEWTTSSVSYVDTVNVEYHFSREEEKWLYYSCKHRKKEDSQLIPFSFIKYVFDKVPGGL